MRLNLMPSERPSSWAVFHHRSTRTWYIALAYKRELGMRYDKPRDEHSGFPTKNAAVQYKRANLVRPTWGDVDENRKRGLKRGEGS